MDAIAYLKDEHNKFRRAFATISKISDENKKQAEFDALCEDLIQHETMEQKIWYPVLRKNSELREIIQHLLSEEKSAAQSIKAFQKVRFNFMWKLRFMKFKYDVTHHAREEEKELFPKVRKWLNKTELNTLGTEMRKFKNELGRE